MQDIGKSTKIEKKYETKKRRKSEKVKNQKQWEI